MIVAEQVSKYYGDTLAVDNISFRINEGENFVLLGTSGCGKTTTIRMLNRLVEPSGGIITINGTPVNKQDPEILRRKIGYVLQHNALFPHYTVAENIAIVPNLLKWDKEKITRRTKVLLGKLNMPEAYLGRYPSELSGGQQQRVNVARALAAEPDILLMDEPFGALDPVTRAGIIKEFLELDEFKKKTIVMVTHDVQEAFELGDKICLMDNGKILQAGKPEELLFRPVNEYVKSFLEKNYLQLLLKEIKIEDIWQELSDVKDSDIGFSTVSVMNSLWEVIEAVSKNDNKHIAIRNEKNNEVKKVALGEIFAAFGKYKFKS